MKRFRTCQTRFLYAIIILMNLLSFTSANDTDGSLVVINKNGTLEIQQDSIEILTQPEQGFLDADLNYSSPFSWDDSYKLRALTADGKTTVDISIFVSPSTGRYSVAYVGSTEDCEVVPDVSFTDLAGIIDGDL